MAEQRLNDASWSIVDVQKVLWLCICKHNVAPELVFTLSVTSGYTVIRNLTFIALLHLFILTRITTGICVNAKICAANHQWRFWQKFEFVLSTMTYSCLRNFYLSWKYSGTCYERTHSGRGRSVPTWEVATHKRDRWAGRGRYISYTLYDNPRLSPPAILVLNTCIVIIVYALLNLKWMQM